jgi:hypothetical protein
LKLIQAAIAHQGDRRFGIWIIAMRGYHLIISEGRQKPVFGPAFPVVIGNNHVYIANIRSR